MNKLLDLKASILLIISIGLAGCNKEIIKNPGTVTDIDGNIYKTVRIGKQIWMAENLRTTLYSNGDKLQWGIGFGQEKGAWTYYNEDDKFEYTYGKLYNQFAAVDERNICPEGWHVPRIEEWLELNEFLGGEDLAGGKMKVTGTEYWVSPNGDATNESGFSAFPGGWATGSSPRFMEMGFFAIFWSSSWNEFVRLSWQNGTFNISSTAAHKGFSVRCLKDQS